MNNALLGKLIWKIVSGDGRFWGEVLKRKYLNQDVGLVLWRGRMLLMFGGAYTRLGRSYKRVLDGK